MGIRKISYFWQNSSKLDFILPSMVKFVRELFYMFNDILKVKNLNYHTRIAKLLYE